MYFTCHGSWLNWINRGSMLHWTLYCSSKSTQINPNRKQSECNYYSILAHWFIVQFLFCTELPFNLLVLIQWLADYQWGKKSIQLRQNSTVKDTFINISSLYIYIYIYNYKCWLGRSHDLKKSCCLTRGSFHTLALMNSLSYIYCNELESKAHS